MKFFADTRIKRHTAFVVLLVWLFALASSVANACLLEPNEPQPGAAQKGVATTLQAPAGHHGDPGDIPQSCLKVCDDGARALPKAYAGIDHNDPGPAPLLATLWTASQPVAAAPLPLADLAAPVFGPPLRVRYARLAL